MKFERNYNLSMTAREEMIVGLTNIAELYFNGEHDVYGQLGKVTIGCGICKALMDVGCLHSYTGMQELMLEMGNDYYGPYGDITEPEEWEPRATMCLFLVEYLKDTIKKEKA
jgi:hypothetical protein